MHDRAAFIPRSFVRSFILSITLLGIPSASSLGVRGEDPDFGERLPRIQPLEPQQALEALETLPGYRVELVAAEPLVVDPIAFCFDESLRLWVVEMRDYSEQETERLGRIARLEDTDGDGRMDRRVTFATDLSWPTAIACWRDGVIVAEPPNLWFLRDTDQDGKMDARELWSQGFQRSNVQGLVNSLRWTVTGHLHGATSSSGAELTSDYFDGKVALRGRDFEIDPLTRHIHATTGGGQHGLSFNRWGDKFVTSNSDHLQQIVEVEPYRQQANAASFPSPRRSIALDGPQAEVYRISPIEPWRILRTELRVSGAVPGIVEGGGRPAGYFTGATGVCVMEPSQGYGLPDEAFDTAIVCDVGSNLIHRKRLKDRGLFYEGERIDPATELLRSKDIWFRPVQLGEGPDGCLYIADMYREVIEHPKSLPPPIKRHLDLTSGNDRGRIWRLVPDQRMVLNASMSMAGLDPLALVESLESNIPWRRTTAARLLLEAQDAATMPALASLARESSVAEARILALHLLARLSPKTLTSSIVFAPMKNGSEEAQARVIQHGLIAWESVDEEVQKAAVSELLPFASHPSLRVRMQLLLSSRKYSSSIRQRLVIASLSADSMLNSRVHPDEAVWYTAAQLNAADQLSDLFDAWGASDSPNVSVLPMLIQSWAQRNSQRDPKSRVELDQSVDALLKQMNKEVIKREVMLAIARLPNRDMAKQLLDRLFTNPQIYLSLADDELAKLIERDTQSKAASMGETALWTRLASINAAQDAWQALLHPSQSVEAQVGAIDAIAWRGTVDDLASLMSVWTQLTGVPQARAWSALIEKPNGWQVLETALSKQPAQGLLNAEQQRQLREHPRPEVRERFTQWLKNTPRESVNELMVKYTEAAKSTKQDVDEGRQVFVKVCAACHAMGGQGADVGPPLGGNIAQKTDAQLLLAILDPSAEVDPKFVAYTVLLKDGRVLSGLMIEESRDAFVLAVSGGQRHRVLRESVEELRRTGKSLMPEGLESQITPAQMQHLIAFLKSTR